MADTMGRGRPGVADEGQGVATTGHIGVVLAGNPNSGKTSLFNFLTGSNQKVGNWGGVTVEKKEGSVEVDGVTLNFLDLPGTYSLSPYSIEEVISRNYITDEAPDIVVNVIDASNVERNLYMTAQLLELGVPVIIALNMIDVAEGRGTRINSELLSQLLGVPVVGTVGRKGQGIEELKRTVLKVANGELPILRHSQITYGKELEQAISSLEALVVSQGVDTGELKSAAGIEDFASQAPALDRLALPSAKPFEAIGQDRKRWDARWLVLRLLEGDRELIKGLAPRDVDYARLEPLLSHLRSKIEDMYEDDMEAILSERIHAFVRGICKEAVTVSSSRERTLTDRVDGLLTSPLLGLPVFGFVMYLMFQTTFTLGAYPMEWLEALFGIVGSFIADLLPADSLLADLLVNGVIDGVGGVVIFLPNIVLLFLFIAVFEDSGYMARAAFLMDRLMHGIGLHGKSFISLLTGFGCNVPGVMAARTLENERDRLVTILINPFMSCSARLPVYILFCGAFFPHRAGEAIFAIYVMGIAVAILGGKILRLTVLKGESAPFVMELPPYRVPTARSLLLHMWERANLFLTKAGTIVLCGVVVMWGLNTFPRDIPEHPEYDRRSAEVTASFDQQEEGLRVAHGNAIRAERAKYDGGRIPFESSSQYQEMVSGFESGIEALGRAEAEEIEKLGVVREMDTIRQRFAGRIGSLIEPAIRPFGFDWRVAVSLIPGFAAKEIVVGSLGVLYQVGEEEEAESVGLQAALRSSGVFTPFRAVLFMIFTLLYVPCLATVATIKRETNSWRWPIFSIVYSVGMAWALTYLVMIVGKFFGYN